MTTARHTITLTDETELQKRWTECLGLGTLPARLDDQMLATLSEVANSPCPPAEPCDDRHLGQCLRMMLAVLPRRNADDLSGELFVAAYQRMLGHLPKDQISFVTETAMASCKWFPTIADCLEMAEGWTRKDEAFLEWRERKYAAQRLISDEDVSRSLEKFRPKPEPVTQADVDKMDGTMIRLGLKCGALVQDADGNVRVAD